MVRQYPLPLEIVGTSNQPFGTSILFQPLYRLLQLPSALLAPAPMPAFQAPGQAYVASDSSGAHAATQEKPKRKRSRKDPTSIPAPTAPDSNASVARAVPATAPKRRKRAAKASTSITTEIPASAVSSDAGDDSGDDDDFPSAPLRLSLQAVLAELHVSRLGHLSILRSNPT
jgi:hypothetical protein